MSIVLPEGAHKDFKAHNVISIAEASKICDYLKNNENKIVGLCHGTFDLLHPGHIKHFESSKGICDILIVSISKQEHVSNRKGNGRPIYDDELRTYSIASLKFVDYVVISEAGHPESIIKEIKPSVYFKGPDYINDFSPDMEKDRRAVESINGKVIYTQDAKLSTAEIIKYIKNLE